MRIIATIAVITIHVSAINWYSTDTHTNEWYFYNIMDSMSRWAVPAFVMISGALFINREIDLKTLYRKYILRLVLAYIVFGGVYAAFLGESASFNDRLQMIFYGKYHMWYIPMTIGLYLCLPISKAIYKGNVKFYICIFFAVSIIVPYFVQLNSDFLGESTIAPIANYINFIVKSIQLPYVSGYAFYFLMGAYIDENIDLNSKKRYAVYLLAITAFFFTAYFTGYFSDNLNQFYYNYFSLNVCLSCIGVFCFIKKIFMNLEVNSIILRISEASFGAYLLHVLMIEKLIVYIKYDSNHWFIWFMFMEIGVVAASFIISLLLNRIPIIRKYVL